jgi:hypothetical protein
MGLRYNVTGYTVGIEKETNILKGTQIHELLDKYLRKCPAQERK